MRVRNGSVRCSPPPGRCRCSARTATGWSTTPRSALIWPDQHGGVGLGAGERGVAVVSQSSSIAISVTMVDIGLPLHSVVAVGNAAQLGVAQVGAALVECERVSALGLIVESLADLRAWETLAARARQRRIGLVALVLGRSEQARRAVITHTASLTTDAAVGAEFLRRTGIGQVDSVDALLGALCLLHCGGPLPGTRLTSLSSSGGEAALIADAAVGRPVSFAQLTAGQRAELRSALGERVALANPLDYHTYVWGDPDAMAAAFTAMVRGPADLHLLFADLPRADRCTDEDWTLAIAAFARACAEAGARGALVAAMAANLDRRTGGGLGPPRAGRPRPTGRGDGGDRRRRARRAGLGGAGRTARRRSGRAGQRRSAAGHVAGRGRGQAAAPRPRGAGARRRGAARAPTPRSARRPTSRARSR